MIKIIHFFIRQRLFINLFVFILLTAGGMVLLNMNREAFPNVSFDMLAVTTLYPGASPDDIEKLVTIPIEKKIREVDGIDKVRSYNIENVSVVVIFVDPDARDKQRIMDDLKDAVADVSNLPENAMRPEIREWALDKKSPAISIALTIEGDDTESYRKLRQRAKDLEDIIYDESGIAEVIRYGYRDREYLVEVTPSALEQYRIGLYNVINQLSGKNIDLPGGPLRIGEKEFTLRTKGQFNNIDDIKNTVVIANDVGYVTRLMHIATVSDTFDEPTIVERFNGKNAIILEVWKKQSVDMIKFTDKIKTIVDAEAKLEKGKTDPISIYAFADFSKFVKSRLSSLIINGAVGSILLAGILFLLLGTRMSLIVSVSIPVSFMVAFMGMSAAGISLNIISMFALVMVLGMIVDFAIVVSENSYRHMENGMSALEAVEKGTAEVFWPLTTTLLVITAAFGPLLFMTGLIGKFIYGIPLVLIISLSASWFSAMFIVPNHLETFGKISGKKGDEESAGFARFREKYQAFLGFVLDHRYATFGILTILFFLSLFAYGVFLKFVFMPGGGGEEILIRTKLPQGTLLSVNEMELKKVEKYARAFTAKELESILSRVGVEVASGLDPTPSEGTHRGTIIMNLTPVGDRDREASDILKELRANIQDAIKKGEISRDMKFDFRVDEDGPPVGLPVNVEIRGEKIDTLKKIAGEYVAYLQGIKGVYDVSIDMEDGKTEYRYKINEVEAARAGLSTYDVASSLHSAFEGNVATKVNDGEDEIDVRVRFPEWARKNQNSMNQVMVANHTGGLVPLFLVTNYEKTPGYSMINRLDYKRVIQVTANIDTNTITSQEVNQNMQKHFSEIPKKYPGYNVNYGGEEEDRNKSMANLTLRSCYL